MKTHRIAGGGGVQLHVVETGNPQGRPLVFIHGASGVLAPVESTDELEPGRGP
jgi:pimeloyl-ACP methyl ester carboxylesterase